MYCLIHYHNKFQGYIILFMSKWKKRVEESLRTDILTSLSRWEFLNAYFGFAYKIKESRTTHPFAMAGQLFKGYFLMSRNFKRSKRNSDYRIVASWFSLVQTDHWNTFSFNLCHKSSNNRSVGIWQDKVCVLAKLKPKLIVVFAVSLVRRDQECYYSPLPPSPTPHGMRVHCKVTPTTSSGFPDNLSSWVERGTQFKYFTQEHDTMTQPVLELRPFDPK